MKQDKISFPRLGDYEIPIAMFLRNTTKIPVEIAPPMTRKTIELGNLYSPESVCIPFKYNLGNFLEAIEKGCNILVQVGGGCRYGYYYEVQEQILKDLGYDITFLTLADQKHFAPTYLYRSLKKLNPKLSIFRFIYYGLLAIDMVKKMDQLDEIIRNRIGFEKEKGAFEKEKKRLKKELSTVKRFSKLHRIYHKYKKKLKKIPIDKPKNRLKIGIIGELYTSMEPFSSYFLEKELASHHIEIKRFTNLTYLLFQKKHETKKLLKKCKNYCKHTIGADGMDNIARCQILIDHHYDGIIHTKPFGCTPEIGAIPIIDKLCHDQNMPIIYFSFDENASEVGIKTRLEAFYDMLEMRKEKYE